MGFFKSLKIHVRHWRRTYAWGGGIIFSVLLIELLLRFLLGLANPPLLVADSEIGYLFQADQDLHRFGNRVHINSYHQRSEDLGTEPDTAVSRVLFLGDSVTWGGALVNQRNTYPEVFENRAERECRKPVESLNASAGSWGVGNLRAYMEEFGTFGSDLVVFQIGSQDLLQGKSDSDPVGVYPSMPTERPASAIQELVSRYLWPRYIKPLVNSAVFVGRSWATPRSGSPGVEPQFKQNMDDLEWMVREVRRAGSRPIILHTPERWEVAGGRDPDEPKYARHRDRFIARMDSLRVPVVNLYEKWKERSNPSRYYRDYIHMNEIGYDSIGHAIWRFVDENSLLGVCRPV